MQGYTSNQCAFRLPRMLPSECTQVCDCQRDTDQKSMSLVKVPMAHCKSSIENYLAQKNLYFQRLAIDHKKKKKKNTEVMDDSKIQ